MRRVAIDRYNREAPVDFLRKCGEKVVELQGIGNGDFAEAPKAHENIAAEGILDSAFRFKEREFYKVAVKRVSD